MDKLKNIFFKIFSGLTSALKWFKRGIYILIAAIMIGLNNSFYNETKMLQDTKNFVEQEQVIDNEDTNE